MIIRKNHLVIAFLIALVLGIMTGIFHGHRSSSDTAFKISSHGDVGAPISLLVTGSVKESDKGIKELVQGKGRVIEEGKQLLYQASSYTYDSDENLTNNNHDQVFAGTASTKSLGKISEAIIGKTEGSRVAYIHTDENQSSVEIVVVDILPTTVQGQSKAFDGGVPFPSISYDPNNQPALASIGQATTTLSVSELIPGHGAQVGNTDAIFANYILVDAWGNVVENTWQSPQPAYIEVNKIFSGLQAGIVDQRVGSRIAITIPSQDAQGNRDLYAIIDILAITQKAED
ncbi:FKBP-type peptidyl-prolyl cis-trans isomerase [Arcanobacterium ihumii]|uniref:FKBP-type peptidyl-prolyl cis-trans isomerase n=1 Tax=Arcanobacterium ihumii TaxID=2138162 RepID=UPI000F52EBBA|nr:hypothetical protein [Arcanobacterium ihumii]